MEYRVNRDDLEQRKISSGVTAQIFNGGDHGLASISLMLGDIQPGDGPRMHRHGYEEVIILHEGRAQFTIEATTFEAQAGDVIVIPADLPHRFLNIGEGPLRQTAVHGSDRVAIEWLE